MFLRKFLLTDLRRIFTSFYFTKNLPKKTFTKILREFYEEFTKKTFTRNLRRFYEIFTKIFYEKFLRIFFTKKIYQKQNKTK